MALTDRLRSIATGVFGGGLSASANTPPQSNQTWDINSSGFRTLMHGGETYGQRSIGEKAALSLPAVLCAAETLCGVFAMTPLHYYRKGETGRERVEDSGLHRIFNVAPNAVQSPFLYKELMMGDLLFNGGSFNFIHRDLLFQPAALSRLKPGGVIISQSWDETDGPEAFYDAALPDGTHRRLTRAELWHVPGFSRDGVAGLNRLSFMGGAIDAAIGTSEFARRYWENNAMPGVAIKISGQSTPEQKQAIKADWKNLFSGRANAGEPAVIDEMMDIKSLAPDNDSAQFIETRNFQVLEVARAFGIPPHLLYELSRATFSNIEQQSLEFLIYCMMRHYDRVASAATHAFAEPGHYFEFMPDALLKGDIKSRYEAYKVAVDIGAMNPNEVRRKENMNDRDGGEDYRVGSGSQIEGQSAPAPAV